MAKAFARWFAERTGGPEPRFEKGSPGTRGSSRILSSASETGCRPRSIPGARSERPGRNARSVRPGLGQHTLELHDGAVAHDLRMR